jgi:hypothetical protein
MPKPNDGGQGGNSNGQSGLSGKGVSITLPIFKLHSDEA